MRWLGIALTAGGLLMEPLPPPASAQDKSVAAPPADVVSTPASKGATVAAESQDKKPAGGARAAASDSPVIKEILDMADAGVSKEVVVTFVKQCATAYQLTPADIILLKQRAVPDEVTLALLNRGAEVKAQANRVRATVAVPAIVQRLSSGGYLDPDSYDFWWYHYAYPRALSFSYRTLAPYYPAHGLGASRSFPPRPRFHAARPDWR